MHPPFYYQRTIEGKATRLRRMPSRRELRNKTGKVLVFILFMLAMLLALFELTGFQPV